MLRNARKVDIWAPQLAEIFAAVPYVFVAGGAARQLIRDEPAAKDIDLFLYDANAFDRAVEALEGIGYAGVELTAASGHFPRRKDGELDVQLIRPRRTRHALTFGTPEEVIDHFSFRTEGFAVEADGTATVLEGAHEDTRAKLLTIHNITDPAALVGRALKYAAKGYLLPAQEIDKLFDAWGERNGIRRRTADPD